MEKEKKSQEIKPKLKEASEVPQVLSEKEINRAR